MWLNLYVCEDVRHKLKNGLKTQKIHFLSVFELISDSPTTIWVEPHQCPLHQSILLAQGPVHEIFEKKLLRIGRIENLSFFQLAILFLFKTFPWKSEIESHFLFSLVISKVSYYLCVILRYTVQCNLENVRKVLWMLFRSLR